MKKALKIYISVDMEGMAGITSLWALSLFLQAIPLWHIQMVLISLSSMLTILQQ